MQKETMLCERSAIIKEFVDRLNKERGGSYKPLSAGFVASKMYNAGLKDDFDLYWFLGYCKDARNFSSCWWWALNPKNVTKLSTGIP